MVVSSIRVLYDLNMTSFRKLGLSRTHKRICKSTAFIHAHFYSHQLQNRGIVL